MKPQDVDADVMAAARWLRAQPDVNSADITVVGWSFGGGVVLAALSEPSGTPLPFSRVIVFYPDCTEVRPWPVGIPILMLQGAQDQIVSNFLCEMRARRSAAPDLVRIVVFPGAKHAFDFTAYAGYPSSRRGFAPESTTAAWREVWAFLQGG
jgi:dienelactone hydrolase